MFLAHIGLTLRYWGPEIFLLGEKQSVETTSL